MPRRVNANPARSCAIREVWRRRRRDDFNHAIQILTGMHSPERLPQLRLAAHVVSETLASHIPAGHERLPRGYRIETNRAGDPGIAFGNVLFNAAYSSAAPDLKLLARLADDLRTGWIREVLEATRAELTFSAFAEMEAIKR